MEQLISGEPLRLPRPVYYGRGWDSLKRRYSRVPGGIRQTARGVAGQCRPSALPSLLTIFGALGFVTTSEASAIEASEIADQSNRRYPARLGLSAQPLLRSLGKSPGGRGFLSTELPDRFQHDTFDIILSITSRCCSGVRR
jgi:hypothetical protein